MRLDESTYNYIDDVKNKIEYITRSFIDKLSEVIDEAEKSHYIVYYEFLNEVRRREIDNSTETCRLFEDVKLNADEMVISMSASEASINEFNKKLNSAEDKFKELVCCAERLKMLVTHTYNPNITQNREYIGSIFTHLKQILSDCTIYSSEDEICLLMENFFKSVHKLYEDALKEYYNGACKITNEIDIRLLRMKPYFKNKAKTELLNDIKAGFIQTGITAAYATLGIKKKKTIDVIEQGIGLIAKVRDYYEKIDKLDDCKLPNSKVRQIINTIGKYNDAVELAGNIAGVMDAGEDNTSFKMAAGLMLVKKADEDIERLRQSGKLDVINASLETAAAFSDVAMGIVTGMSVHDVIKKIPAVFEKGIGLVAKTSLYIHENDYHIKNKAVDRILHKIGAEIKKYNTSVFQNEIEKEKMKMISNQQEAPPYIIEHKFLNIISKIQKEGEGLNEIIRTIL